MPGAVVLAAGAGSRLRAVAPVKPLVPVAGRPLVLHVIGALRAAGIGQVAVVAGHAAAEVAAAVAHLPDVATVANPAWDRAPNGVSVLAARAHIREGTLLVMGDHLVSPQLLQRLVDTGPVHDGVALAVDRRLGHPAVDEADVTRVRTRQERIVDLGKDLRVYDAHDTGAFLVGPALVAALGQLDSPSLSDGVRLLARAGRAVARDIGDAFWLDIDDPRALALAERHVARA